MICRNCNSSNILIAKNRGVIAPFFLKRIYNLHISKLSEKIDLHFSGTKSFSKNLLYSIYKFLNNFFFFKKIFNIRSNINVDIVLCRNCLFISTKKEYSFNELENLYLDYRNDTYNNERVFYEPHYNEIKDLVGKNLKEIKNRQKNLDSIFIEENVNINRINSVIDWGGNEGHFIPSELKKKNIYIFDPSISKPIEENYTKINKRELLPNVDCLLVAHVLEHVGNPKKFLIDILNNLNKEGILYLEVPEDKNLDEIEKMINNPNNSKFEIHEHINIYNEKSLKLLCSDLGLELIHCSRNEIDVGWDKNFKIISALFKKI
ncbi:class I SAM-dependent methyltransferase [Candidatus Pelagibacter ubique]|nr:class I SAM-dependent methyltransferase [Candidatus Pelagibacter ubique]